MNDEYYLVEGGEKKGPYTFNELINRELTIHTEIITPQSDTPQYASELPELNAYFESQGIYFPTLDNLAPYISRIFAFIIDYFLIGTITLLVVLECGWVQLPKQPTFILPYRESLIMFASYATTFLVYNVSFELSKIKGSIGKAVFKIIVVDINGQNLKMGNSIVKNLGVLISCMLYALPFFSVFLNEHRQAWYEKLSKAYQITKNS